MITVHHLNNSRSQRLLWLLEELGLDYEIKRYERDKKTNLAPAAMKKVHPLGKSPILEADGYALAETGAIFEYVIDQYGEGRLRPAPGGAAHLEYRYWMFAAEGSYMPPLLIALLLNRMETAPMPFFVKPVARRLAKGLRDGYADQALNVHFEYAESVLGKSEWLAGGAFSAADIMMSFPFEGFAARGDLSGAKNIAGFLKRIHERPAYQRALEKGGPYSLLK